jgi:peptidoglycan/xylan/chitin deacetylase (PgdA/CDA1 family)
MTAGPPDDRAQRRAQAGRRRRRRRENAALGAVVTVALMLAAVWAVSPGMSLRSTGGPEQASASADDAPAREEAGRTASTPTRAVTARAADTVAAPRDTHERDYGLTRSGTPARAKVTVPVLMYHRVAPASTATNAVSRGLTVTPAAFRAQMAWLRRNGFTAVTQAEVFRAIQDGAALPRKPVLLTFDDGYVDAVNDVLPTLRSLGFPATFFIITGRIGARAFLDADQLRTLSAAGMDIGSHTVEHLELPSLDPATRARQLSASRAALETLLGHPVRWFCYPAGRNDAASARAVADAGYLLAYTTAGGSVLRSGALTRLPRVRVAGEASLDAFATSVRAASAAT